jgi:hypothetical protein
VELLPAFLMISSRIASCACSALLESPSTTIASLSSARRTLCSTAHCQAQVCGHCPREVQEELALLPARESASKRTAENCCSAVLVLEASKHRPQPEIGDVARRADPKSRLVGVHESRRLICDPGGQLQAGGRRRVLGGGGRNPSGRRPSAASDHHDADE